MDAMMELKGITWDHERGYNPLIPVTEDFCRANPGVTITWAKRSLKDFGDYPVSKLAEHYDLIMIDHPFMAEALRENLLVPLNEHLSPGYLDKLNRDTMGLSLDSYCVDGTYLGLPVDAATQVAAANTERMRRAGASVPARFDQVLALKDKLGPNRIGTAMAPTDIFSTYLGFVAQLSGRSYFDPAVGIDLGKGEQAAARLYELADASHPDSFEMNPIQLLDAMAEREEILYTPYLYGYTNYSRDGFRAHLLEFFDAPLLAPDAEVSTQLGGVGISITHRVTPEQLPIAVAFAEYLASPKVQRGVYTKADGQPAARSAWMDGENNRITHNFFRNTAHTLDTAFLRPKVVRWNQFQEAEGERIHRQVKERASCQSIAEGFNKLYQEICASGS